LPARDLHSATKTREDVDPSAGPGVKVAGVTPGSPAEKAGVKEGDVLLKIDGKDVASLQGFSGLLRELTPGQTVKVVLLRGGQEQTLDVTVVER
jgi:serine protease Do